jgi:hypothetical protein
MPSLANVIANEEPASPPPTTSTSKLGPCPTNDQPKRLRASDDQDVGIDETVRRDLAEVLAGARSR